MLTLSQELQNHLVWMSLEQKLYHAPVTNLDRILDVGCGTGQWTIEFGASFHLFSAQDADSNFGCVKPTHIPRVRSLALTLHLSSPTRRLQEAPGTGVVTHF